MFLFEQMHPDKEQQHQEEESPSKKGDFSEVTRAYAQVSREDNRRIHDATLLGEKESEAITIKVE
jgi:DnaJ-class molecular chaperone